MGPGGQAGHTRAAVKPGSFSAAVSPAADARMSLDRTSRTQLSTAIKRAVHQLRDSPLILDDPVALRVVPEAADPAVLARLSNGGAPDADLLRSLFVMRSRFAEDRLAQAAARGVRQFVMIGAGLDTFPWRQPDFARSMRLFAADHPASLEFARDRMRECGLTPPANLSYVPVDLNESDLGDQLVAHGFDLAIPSLCAMLGVAQYLPPDAVDAVFRSVSRLARQSEIVFSFALPDADLAGEDLLAAKASAKFAASLGEPWLCRLRPSDLTAQLRSLGFRDIFHLGPENAQQRYFAGRRDSLRAPGWEQVIAAML